MVKLHSYDEKKVSFYYMDEHARKASSFARWNTTKDYASLVTHLSKALPYDKSHREILLARGFLVWVSEDLSARDEVDFKTFCAFANIECVKISGKAKGASYEVGGTEVRGASWNAFKGDGRWHLLHPYWCVASLVGYHPGGRVSLESDGNTKLKEISFSSGKLVSFFREDCFCIDPNVFLVTHFPDDPQWQLRSGVSSKAPVTYEEWLNMPYLQSNFFKQNLRLVTEESCRLGTKKGSCSIVFSGDRDVFRNLSFSYNILLKSTDAPNPALGDLRRKIVIPERMDRDGLFKYNIGCPVKGIYFLEILSYNINAEVFGECCEFLLECEEPDPNCRTAPVDPGTLGFGFGPFAEEAGLRKPSETGANVFMDIDEAGDQVGGKAISFKVDPDAAKEYEYGSCMCEDDEEEPVTTTLNEAKRQLTINAPAKLNKEYALALNKRKKDSGENFETVLYYLVTSNQEDKADSERLATQVKEKKKEIKLEEKTMRNASLKEQIEQTKAAIEQLNRKQAWL